MPDVQKYARKALSVMRCKFKNKSLRQSKSSVYRAVIPERRLKQHHFAAKVRRRKRGERTIRMSDSQASSGEPILELDYSVPSRDTAVGYMLRTRNYYRALGYEQDYSWAQNDDVPFTAPKKPLNELRLALITTSSPAGTTKQTTPAVWSADSSQIPDTMYTDNLAWDKDSTHTNDTGSFLPLKALHTLVANGELGSLAPRYHGVPTEYSQRQTLNDDAPDILDRVIEDGADIALLVPL